MKIRLLLSVVSLVAICVWLYYERSPEPAAMAFIAVCNLIYHFWHARRSSDEHVLTAETLRTRTFDRRTISSDEFDALYVTFTRVFGQDIAGLEVLRRIHIKNRFTIWGVVQEEPGGESDHSNAIGFFEVFPLQDHAVKRVLAGAADGRTMRDGDIYREKGRNPTHYYIASVGVMPDVPNELKTLCKAATIKQLLWHVAALNQARQIHVYTRPVTRDGLRLTRKYGFIKIHEDKIDEIAIWKRTLKKGELLEQVS